MKISEIAALAGVSSAAVSRYLNGGSISKKKKDKIKKIIEETGYVPNVAARVPASLLSAEGIRPG